MHFKTIYHVLLQVLLFNTAVCLPNADSEPYCALPNKTSYSSRLVKYDDSASISPRARPAKQPLKGPASRSQKDFDKFMKASIDDERDTGEVGDLFLTPTDADIAAFTIDYQGKQFRSGTTGVYYDLKNKARDFVMTELHGCTAVIVINPLGIWGLHIWESETGPDRAAGFRTFTTTGQPGAIRPDADFKALAVDIIGQATPANLQNSRKKWKSLIDVKNRHGDPFKTGADATVLMFTPSVSRQDAKADYSVKVSMIERKIRELLPDLPRSNFLQKTYVRTDTRILEKALRGAILVQYSPYDHDGGSDGRTPQARARAFIENKSFHVFDKTWPASK